MVAFVFPGQGTDVARTGPPWLERPGPAHRLLEEAARRVDLPVERLFAAGGRVLERTEVLQPVVTALCLGIHHELGARGVRPDLVAGHSLGEVAASAAAGAMGAEDAVTVSAVRGRLMSRAAERHPGGMLALTAAEPAVAEAALAVARTHGLAAFAAHNAPGQWVVAGGWEALRAVAARFPTTPVPVSGPWHTDAMAGAVEGFRDALRDVVQGPLAVPLVCNRTGERVTEAGELPDLLAGQFTRPVEWVKVMATMVCSGVTDAVFVGPAKALRGLARRNLGTAVALHAAELPEDLDPIAEVLAR
jgi:[acyl-carrier-protein] S-malonyltransferase